MSLGIRNPKLEWMQSTIVTSDRFSALRHGVLKTIRLAAAVGCFIACQNEALVAEAAKILEPRQSPVETVVTSVPVSGNTFLGLRVDPADTPFGEPIFAFLPPTHDANSLCLQIMSVDGQYSGRFEYDILGVGGPVQLVLRTKYAHRLQQYSNGQIAVLAGIATTCGGAVNAIVALASRSVPYPKAITLFINAKGIDTEVRYGAAERRRTSPCDKLSNPDRTAFDTQCALLLEQLAGPLDIVILRRRDELHLPPIHVRLLR